ncbi:MAG: diguanylate cyclase [bacterium]|nr:diguanylate cyclase [bacterium]
MRKERVLEKQLGKAVETMPLGLTITDVEGKILYTNPVEARMHGYTVDELIGQDLGIFAPAELRDPMTVEQLGALLDLRESVNVKKDGSIFPVRLLANVLKDADGLPVAVVTMCEDISEYKRSAEKLRRHTRELSLLNHLSDALQECENEEQTYPVVADVCQQLFPEESGCLCILKQGAARMEVAAFWGEAPASKQASAENASEEPEVFEREEWGKEFSFLCPHRLYSPHHECLSLPIVASSEVMGLLSFCFQQTPGRQTDARRSSTAKAQQVILTRITRHYALTLTNLRLRNQLRIEAMHDSLTGLYNRRYMEDSLERETHRARRYNGQISIIMIDIDYFKLFNDLHGHKVGDMVLRELGRFLRESVRGEDIACRYGGEEFMLILPNANLEAGRLRAEELRRGIKLLGVSHKDQHFCISISAGVAALPDHGTNIREVVDRSDLALYQAKSEGRDRVVVASL